jgi:hypothetical protein
MGHPELAARIAAARRGAEAASGPPSLDASQWVALRTICS